MPVPLYHLVYQSSATASLQEPELQAILAQSRAWNTAHGLTGVLLYSQGEIMQVLEGSQEEVYFIFEKIERDFRHHDVLKLADGPIQQRNFSQWSMGFKAVNPADFKHLKGYLNPARAPRLLSTATSEDAALYDLLATFVREDVIRF
ncbi:BLUF domain-containing protein [Hymenobacter elongatus]|uniref:BLUF domain-containing protein n=1 Tax=Hymenobacter elongatus TaxID=877208 RepID=A0A4Z0PK43_9BACT|nr:BLUF domain-containing protein [Hymenobacter elongatus]TGE15429.1 BLUF domain-containing protein [Hymenobacter elongatus]